MSEDIPQYRADVADTVEKRREKAFLKTLEELKQEVGQWGEYVEIVTGDPASELSEDDQLAMLARIDEIRDAVDQLVGAVEKLINLTGGNTEIVMEYFEKINKSLSMCLEIQKNED